MLLAYDRIQTIDFFLSQIKDLAETLSRSPELALRDYVRRRTTFRVDVMFNRAASPGVYDLHRFGRHTAPFGDRVDEIDMRQSLAALATRTFCCLSHVAFPPWG